MPQVKIHKDYSEEYDYEKILKAWVPINGTGHHGRYLFIAKMKNTLPDGEFMAYLRWPNKETKEYNDRPLQYEGFKEDGLAEKAIYDFACGNKLRKGLGWRIREMEIEMLPTEIDMKFRDLIWK